MPGPGPLLAIVLRLVSSSAVFGRQSEIHPITCSRGPVVTTSRYAVRGTAGSAIPASWGTPGHGALLELRACRASITLIALIAWGCVSVSVDTAPDKQVPLLLVSFLFVVVVLFLLCAGLLMLVFRRVRPLESGSPETGPRLRRPGELPVEAIAHETSHGAQPSGVSSRATIPQPAREGNMSEADIEYRGHFIDVQSSESDGKGWRAKAVVSIYHGGTLHQKTVAPPIEVLFDSETEADTYSLAVAKKWIDDNS